MEMRLPRRPSRRGAIDPFIVMDVMRSANEKAAAGADIVHMEVGQPATPAPYAAREAAIRAIREERLGYTDALGIPPLRERIAGWYRERHGLDIPAERVIVTSGSSAGFVLAFLALFDAGESVLLSSPAYPCYRHILTALGLEPKLIEAGPETRWAMTVPQVMQAAAQGASGVLIASPANPTGVMIEPQSLSAIARACEASALWLISDEIYHGLHYGEPGATALSVSDVAIVVNSFSKYFSMTGWRVGWVVAPVALVRTMERLAQNLYISPPAISQYAALGAFDSVEELEAIRLDYARNRTLLLDALPAMGIDKFAPPDGAFYLYADVSRFTDNSVSWCRRMLNEIGVAITPGIDFDAGNGSRFVRLSYAESERSVADGIKRIRTWLKQ